MGQWGFRLKKDFLPGLWPDETCGNIMRVSGGGAVLEEQTEDEPEGGEVQTDQAVYIELCLAVIPGTAAGFPKEPAGAVLGQKDQPRVDAAAADGAFLQEPAAVAELLPDGADGGRHAVNGEHVEGGLPHEPLVVVPGSGDQAAVA